MAFLGNTPTTQAFTPAVDVFSGNGSTTAFTLSRPVASVAQVQAFIENVPQSPVDAFTVNGNTITFTSAPPSGSSNIYVRYTSPITQVIAPTQGTVSPASLTAGAPTWDANGNLSAGGVAPSAWGNTGAVAGYKAAQVNNAGVYSAPSGSNTLWSSNAYYDGTNWRYITAGYAALLSQTPAGYHVMQSAPSGSAGGVITWTTTLQVPKDNTLALQGANAYAGTGISFPATQNASSDANTLDDYEEGTFTATVNSGGGSFSASGRYTKIGRLVNIMVNVQYSATAGTANNLTTIAGLPFVNNSGQNVPAPVGLLYYMSSSGTNNISTGGFLVADGTSYINLYLGQWGTAEALPRFVNSFAYFQVSATYYT